LGVRDDDARRLEAFARDARAAALGEEPPDSAAELDLPLPGPLETEIPGLVHHVAELPQAVRRHRRMVGVAAALVRLHDLEPLAEIHREARALRLVDAPARVVAEHHERRARRSGPAL